MCGTINLHLPLRPPQGSGKARLGFHVGGIVVGDSHGINLDLGLGDLKVRSWNVSWTPGMKLRTQRAK
jgi:hypothetical protein